MSPGEADGYVDGERLGRVVELLAGSPMDDVAWKIVRSFLLVCWPRKSGENLGDGRQEGRPAEVLPVEGDVDVPEVGGV